jgi:hypothetical protein
VVVQVEDQVLAHDRQPDDADVRPALFDVFQFWRHFFGRENL